MAKTLNKGYADSVVATKNVAIPSLSWGTDFKTKVDDPNEVIVTNVTCPLDRPETIRFGYTEIADVYKNTSIDSSVYAPTKRGIQLLAQVNDVYTVTDSVDTQYRVDLPVQAHLVIKVPANELITADEVNKLIARAVSTFYATATVTSEKIAAMIRGSLRP
jgi:hypothetical protein